MLSFSTIVDREVHMKRLEIKNYLCLNSAYRNKEFIINLGLSYIVNGLDVIESLRSEYPNAKIMMDLKINEDDYLNSKIAFDTEVDIVSVLGNACNKVIQKTMQIAKANNKEVIIDLRNVNDLKSKIEDMEILGVDYLLLDQNTKNGSDLVLCFYNDNVEQFLKLQMIAQELTI